MLIAGQVLPVASGLGRIPVGYKGEGYFFVLQDESARSCDHQTSQAIAIVWVQNVEGPLSKSLLLSSVQT